VHQGTTSAVNILVWAVAMSRGVQVMIASLAAEAADMPRLNPKSR